MSSNQEREEEIMAAGQVAEIAQEDPARFKFNFYALTGICQDKGRTIQWCKDHGLLPNPDVAKMCPACKSHVKKDVAMKFCPEFDNEFGSFRCQKVKNHRNNIAFQISGLKGTWFEGSKLSIQRTLIMTFCFVKKMSYDFTIESTSIPEIKRVVTSTATVCDWFSYCREVCMDSLDQQYQAEGQIGGPGRIVEIDESKIGKRKYNRGRMVEGSWVFGMVERDSPNYRLEICPENRRDAVTLLALLQKHVAPGTIIFSDMWKAYDRLDQHGNEHGTVNHSVNFVDPVTGVHTNTIESNWRPLKNRIERGGVGGKPKLAEHLCEYLWMRKHKEEDTFLSFIQAVARLYNP